MATTLPDATDLDWTATMAYVAALIPANAAPWQAQRMSRQIVGELNGLLALASALALMPAQVADDDDDQAELIESLQTLADSSERPQDYARAVEDVRAGVTCESIADGVWHVQRVGHDFHVVTREGCDCQSRAGGCRHMALVHGVEFQLRVQEEMKMTTGGYGYPDGMDIDPDDDDGDDFLVCTSCGAELTEQEATITKDGAQCPRCAAGFPGPTWGAADEAQIAAGLALFSDPNVVIALAPQGASAITTLSWADYWEASGAVHAAIENGTRAEIDTLMARCREIYAALTALPESI